MNINLKHDEIIMKLTPIFCDVFDDECIVIKDETTALDIEGWDSIGHIRLAVAIEAALGIKFNPFELSSWPNVGALVKTIEQKMAG